VISNRRLVRASLVALAVPCVAASPSIQSAPLLSGKVAAAGSPTSGLNYLNDGRWGNGGWSVSSGSWVAYKVGAGPSRLLLAWNVPTYSWSNDVGCKNGSRACLQSGGIAMPTDYDILVSSNSTNGQDGDWTSVVGIKGNSVSSRMHYVTFSGKSWVKLRIGAGSGTLDEVDVFDASKANPEAWFFVGNSITAGAWKSVALPAGQDFSARVAAVVPGRVPPVVRGGIPCIITADVANDLARYLADAEGATIWGISLGTNDAWGGGSNISGYRTALLKIVDALDAKGIKPVIARFSATNAGVAGWQVGAAYMNFIDSLVKARGYTPGPDLYGYFLSHPSELGSDGIHPNNTGYASIQRLWAEVAAKIAIQDPSSNLVGEARLASSGPRIEEISGGWRIGCGGRCARIAVRGLDGRAIARALGGEVAIRKEDVPAGPWIVDALDAEGRRTSGIVIAP